MKKFLVLVAAALMSFGAQAQTKSNSRAEGVKIIETLFGKPISQLARIPLANNVYQVAVKNEFTQSDNLKMAKEVLHDLAGGPQNLFYNPLTATYSATIINYDKIVDDSGENYECKMQDIYKYVLEIACRNNGYTIRLKDPHYDCMVEIYFSGILKQHYYHSISDNDIVAAAENKKKFYMTTPGEGTLINPYRAECLLNLNLNQEIKEVKLLMTKGTYEILKEYHDTNYSAKLNSEK